MDSKDIIKNIDSIYEKFSIPPNLVAHMKKVASVGSLICDNIKNISVDRENIVAFLLIHDLGNIIKFRFDNDLVVSMLGTNDENVINHWKKVRENVIQNYGKNVIDANKKMACEVGVNDKISHLLEAMDFSKADVIAKGSDWDVKVCAYSDFRVGPFGIVSLRDRLDDLRRRYQGHDFDGKEYSFTSERVEFLYECYFEIERQIMKNCSLKPEDINEASISYFDKF